MALEITESPNTAEEVDTRHPSSGPSQFPLLSPRPAV
jgi:hypothetical protein